MSLEDPSFEDELHHSQNQGQMDAVSFADSLTSFGCSMRDKFISVFSYAWSTISNKPDNEINFMSAASSYIQTKFQLGNGLSSFLTPDFTPDVPIFSNDSGEFTDDFFGAHRGGEKFLDIYSKEEAATLIRNSSIGTMITNLGYDDWYVEFDLSDCFVHYAYVRSRSVPELDHYIGFLIVQKGNFYIKGAAPPDTPGIIFAKNNFPKDSNMLNIRWFSLQNPKAKFSAKKPRLPGQRFPGSGLARECFSLFCKLALKSSRDGIVNVPEHFHNAFLYEKFIFINPEDEGEFERMKVDLADDIKWRGLAAVSWAIFLGFLREGDNVKKWQPHEQVFPLSFRLYRYFKSSEFNARAVDTQKKCGPFRILWDEAENYCMSAVVEFSNDENPNHISRIH